MPNPKAKPTEATPQDSAAMYIPVLTVGELRLTDAQGRVRATLGTDPGSEGAGLLFYGPEGGSRVGLCLGANQEPILELCDASQTPRVHLSLNPDTNTTTLQLLDQAGQGRLVLTQHGDQSTLQIFDAAQSATTTLPAPFAADTNSGARNQPRRNPKP